MKKEIIPALEIMEFLKRYSIKDIAIALMQMELRDGEYPIKLEDYNKFNAVYNSYLADHKYEHLTGLLNEVLQNADNVYEELKEEIDLIKDKNI
ncbi:MAG: hypothetical protein PHR25_02095 [Clostridia bacterium]|nr:hypothetical protein [Clostridia bacterium]